MSNAKQISWVCPPLPISGRDHLGVQAPCVELYTQLLPGITNVTDRARYYSFHPWVIWSFEHHYKNHSLDEFRRVLRRAECLFALIAIRHARVLRDDNENLHGAAMVGRQELLKIPKENDVIVLDDYAALEGPNRYFKNKLGGLGQYYFGPLRDMRILDRSPKGITYPPGYDRDRGSLLAEAFDNGVPGKSFFNALEAPTLTWTDLDELANFCPCALRVNPAEHELLLDLFLSRTENFRSGGGEARRASLSLMLDLAGLGIKRNDYSFEGLLRGASYTGTLPDGSLWQVSESFQRAQRGWGTYQHNELLSLALQGLFAAVLGAVERDRGGALRDTAEVGEVCVSLLHSLRKKFPAPLTAFIAKIRDELPELGHWQDPKHELQRGWRLKTYDLQKDKLENVAIESVYILAALLARGVDDYPYAYFEFDLDHFDSSEIHLLSFRHTYHTDWAHMTLKEWIQWLSVRWGVNRHFQVALRKLRGEQRDTFRIRPLEGELRVVETPPPEYTTPRVYSSMQILRDLDLIDFNDQSAVVLTERGQRELEACRGE